MVGAKNPEYPEALPLSVADTESHAMALIVRMGSMGYDEMAGRYLYNGQIGDDLYWLEGDSMQRIKGFDFIRERYSLPLPF